MSEHDCAGLLHLILQLLVDMLDVNELMSLSLAHLLVLLELLEKGLKLVRLDNLIEGSLGLAHGKHVVPSSLLDELFRFQVQNSLCFTEILAGLVFVLLGLSQLLFKRPELLISLRFFDLLVLDLTKRACIFLVQNSNLIRQS